MAKVNQLKGQPCPFCNTKNMTLSEMEEEIPFFGKVHVFSMDCSNCHYHKSDVEAEEQKEPTKFTITVNKEKDMKIRVIKSSNAAVKIPQLRMSVRPGPASIGYISNIEGLLDRFVKVIEDQRNGTEDPKEKKHAKNLLKKLRKVKFGDIPLKIIIEDPSGNSAIISETIRFLCQVGKVSFALQIYNGYEELKQFIEKYQTERIEKDSQAVKDEEQRARREGQFHEKVVLDCEEEVNNARCADLPQVIHNLLAYKIGT